MIVKAGNGKQGLGIMRTGAARSGDGVANFGMLDHVLEGTGAEVAERADNFLAGTLGSEDAFDEEKVRVGLALVSPRGFADVHSLDTN